MAGRRGNTSGMAAAEARSEIAQLRRRHDGIHDVGASLPLILSSELGDVGSRDKVTVSLSDSSERERRQSYLPPSFSKHVSVSLRLVT